jgi:hypothetical protein
VRPNRSNVPQQLRHAVDVEQLMLDVGDWVAVQLVAYQLRLIVQLSSQGTASTAASVSFSILHRNAGAMPA